MGEQSPLGEDFWDTYASAYDPGTAENFTYRQLHQLVLEGVEVPEGGLVVDAGCGTLNYGAKLLHDRRDIHLVGVDASSSMLRVADRKLEAMSLNGDPNVRDRARTLQARLGTDPWLDDLRNVDVILSINMLYTLSDPDQFLADAYQALRPGGVIHLVNLARPKIDWIVDAEFNWMRSLDVEGEEFARYSAREWARDVVLQLNRHIAKRSRQNFTHLTTAKELEDRLLATGFSVVESVERVYAETCCLVRARKPEPSLQVAE